MCLPFIELTFITVKSKNASNGEKYDHRSMRRLRRGVIGACLLTLVPRIWEVDSLFANSMVSAMSVVAIGLLVGRLAIIVHSTAILALLIIYGMLQISSMWFGDRLFIKFVATTLAFALKFPLYLVFAWAFDQGLLREYVIRARDMRLIGQTASR